ncbi:MAG TPA: ATP-binding cassette domain-containing protein, partial [Beutenbergiaceae bacterium]|nr:ATP-binding cassette domain-containing protein [Beutenbergiaceae bacterium]
MSTPILTVENLDVAYGSTPTVHGVNLELTPGHTVALVGESGSGKTTTAQAILGLLPPGGRVTSGEVRLGDTAITRWSDARMRSIRGRRIGWVPQDPHTSLNPTKTIGEAIAEAMLIHKAGSPKQIRSRVVELLERVGIDNPDLRARQY